MINLKQVAQLAKEDAELRQYITRVFRDSPKCTFRRLAETAIEMAEQLTSDLQNAPLNQTTRNTDF